MRLARARRGDLVLAGHLEGDHLVPFATGPVGGGTADRTQDALLAAAMARTPPAPVADPVAVADVDLLAPVGRPPSVRDFYAFEAHVATARRGRGLDVDPDWYDLPVFYFSNPASVVDPGSAVRAPVGCHELDYELEVAAVIGTDASDVDPGRWLEVVAGFCIMNDWSARDLQRREMRQGLGPAKGKDFALGLGPLLVTPDELPEVTTGRPVGSMVARVNGVERSRGQLAEIHHPWGALVAHASRSTTLRPGDVLGSGTVGTGCLLELGLTGGRAAAPWLVPGDLVELEVEGLGVLSHTVAT